MTDDEILRIAKEVGLEYKDDELRSQIDYGVFFDDLKDFTALVVAATVEECAKLCEQVANEDARNELKWAAKIFSFYIRERVK